MKHFTIPIFIPELACPNQCIYCNQRVITGKQEIPQPNQVATIIDSHLNTISKNNSIIEIGFFGGNFTAVDQNIQKQLLSAAYKYIQEKKVDSIRVSTRPDYINDEKLALLKQYGVKTIELGVQSLDDEVLLMTERGYSSAIVEKSTSLILKSGFKLGLQMMIGLPGDTKEKSLQTAMSIIELGASETRIYPCLVIKDTELENLYIQKKYKPLSLIEAVDWVKPIYLLFEKNKVTILRIGLHPSKEFLDGTAFIDGPFHVSFKELVLSAIWNDILHDHITTSAINSKNIVIEVSEEELNFAIGYHSCNKNQLLQRFNNVGFKINTALNKRELNVCYH